MPDPEDTAKKILRAQKNVDPGVFLEYAGLDREALYGIATGMEEMAEDQKPQIRLIWLAAVELGYRLRIEQEPFDIEPVWRYYHPSWRTPYFWLRAQLGT